MAQKDQKKKQTTIETAIDEKLWNIIGGMLEESRHLKTQIKTTVLQKQTLSVVEHGIIDDQAKIIALETKIAMKRLDEIRASRHFYQVMLFHGKKPPEHIWCKVKHKLIVRENNFELMDRLAKIGDHSRFLQCVIEGNKLDKEIQELIEAGRILGVPIEEVKGNE